MTLIDPFSLLAAAPGYQTLPQLIKFLAPSDRAAANKLLAENATLLQKAPGSSHNHQNWPGGWWHHTEETMNIGRVLFGVLNDLRPLPFACADLLVCLLLHDLEKPWRWRDGTETLKTKQDRHDFRLRMAQQYGFAITQARLNGIKYAEGELNDYRADARIMNELAALVHTCDILSARLWYDRPGETKDSWSPSRESIRRFKDNK